ncbi:hypothetical protein [Burkholderia ambifaria]|uniref:hypothetical protein n=1 Tax=Burkholderia TaxID=32008 RepID=UPI00158F3C29|nr:hypothetical protein [Burkholderia ambifaria]
MTNFYVTKVLDGGGIVRPDTGIYGDVELRSAKSDRKDEAEAITTSSSSSKTKIDFEIASRICTIVSAQTTDEAIQLADERFVPVLDLLSAEHALAHCSATSCGYLKNLDSGEIVPIQSNTFNPSLSFLVQQGFINKFNFNQWILKQNTDLASRYMRSLHWSRSAKWEKSVQASILYRWFAIEALFKRDVNDDITSLLLLFLGFPGGTHSRDISRDLLHRLANNEKHKQWKKRLQDIVDKMRIFRNNSVHSGFRSVDYPLADLRLYERVISLSSARCQSAVANALISNIDTIDEFKNQAGSIFERHVNVENDIVGNVIFSLENPATYAPRNPYV